MKPTTPLLLLLTLSALGCQQHVAPAPPPMASAPPLGALRSPWDTTPIASTSVPYNCGPVITVGPEITIAGSLDKNRHVSEDVKDAVYSQSTTAVEDMTAAAVRAADAYRASGSTEAATCAIAIIAANANSLAMTGYMAGDEPWAARSLSLHGLVIAYLKVRPANVATPAQISSILDWFEGLTRMEREHYEALPCNHDHCQIHNHKGNGVAMEAAAVAVAANDPALFHWAIGQYHSAVADINSRGMLYYDTKKQGKSAFKDNLRSAAYLVQIAEFGEINNVPLYGYDNGIIHLLVHTVALGIVSPEPYHAATGYHQSTPSTVEPWEILWASVYNRRFPDPIITSLLQQVGPASADMWGGEPWNADA